jgi:hypothetical protein
MWNEINTGSFAEWLFLLDHNRAMKWVWRPRNSTAPHPRKGKKMSELVPIENITGLIYLIRGKKVMLDRDLASLYGVETKRLKERVKRNIERFPEDFMFELSKMEYENLRSQNAASSWGGTRYAPMVFTKHGVLMISSVLKSDKADQVNI